MEYNEVKEGDKYIGGVENEGKKKNRFIWSNNNVGNFYGCILSNE